MYYCGENKKEINDIFAIVGRVECMKLIRTEWQIHCVFNSFCKKVLKHEAINTYYHRRKQ